MFDQMSGENRDNGVADKWEQACDPDCWSNLVDSIVNREKGWLRGIRNVYFRKETRVSKMGGPYKRSYLKQRTERVKWKKRVKQG